MSFIGDATRVSNDAKTLPPHAASEPPAQPPSKGPTPTAAPAIWDKPRYDVWLLAAMLGLLMTGIVMVYSSSALFAFRKTGDAFYFLKRQALFATLGLVVMAAVMRSGYQWLHRFAYPILFLTAFGVLLTYLPGLGLRVNGAQRWIRMPGFQLQPSEFAKLAICIYLARSVSEKGSEQLQDFKLGMMPHLMVLGAFIGIIVGQPDLGTSIVLAGVTVMVLLIAGARITYLFGLVGVLVPVGVIAIVTSEYRIRRLKAFFDPFADRYGGSYQVAEALMSVGSGGLTGQGLGAGKQKLGFLPEGHTDYILASIGEELGLVGILFVMSLFAIIIWRGTRAARFAADPFGTFLATGITMLFAIEACINAGMCLALLPSKGLALPFVSYGGTSIVKAMLAGGILLSISGGGGGYLESSAGATRCT
jgi:cell division protein FtsW